ncbi:MAG: NAD(P)H-hydrate dehydratase [Proteocatella sp.]
MQILTKEEMYTADRYAIVETGISGYTLMECAGQAMAEEIKTYIDEKEAANPDSGKNRYSKILVISGPGNNGGDGIVIARRLLNKGMDAQLWICEAEASIKNEALEALGIYKKSNYYFNVYTEMNRHKLEDSIKNADIIIDALLGIGATGIPREPYKHMIQEINKSEAYIFSVDIPSGVGADEADSDCGVYADVTLTIQFPKLSAYLYPVAENYGQSKLIDIGITCPKNQMKNPRFVWTEKEHQQVTNLSKKDDHKGKNGSVLIIGGSRNMIGAPIMATMACARAGTGLVYLGTPKANKEVAASRILEAMHLDCKEEDGYITDVDMPEKVDIVAIGMGLGRNPLSMNLVEKILDSDIPILIDGDGLYFLKEKKEKLKQRKAITVITPHMGEMAGLCDTDTDDIRKYRFNISREFAMEYGVYVVLKGPNTIVSCPNGTQYVNTSGNQSLAKGGAGDILAGIVAGKMAVNLKKEAIYMEAKKYRCDNFENKETFKYQDSSLFEDDELTGKTIIDAVYIHGKAADRLIEAGGEYQSILPTDLVWEL